ncbi:hypothetical protein HMPREF9087_0230 [Enterococcus casseliflavus ATCC 12755]|uniref:Uncharacterized protein n=1 Tax=Enterococcus casseliflavus ATCC 12755 TaxID=888066 RepID=F0EGD3_ENTCA|nr:hypothetical protein HMPREF9087_0230 [Enterococcus casseliflavus ATCC 12755]
MILFLFYKYPHFLNIYIIHHPKSIFVKKNIFFFVILNIDD